MDNKEIEILPGNFYSHKIDHRNNSGEKSQWIITETEERNCFKNSLEFFWIQPDCYISWGLHFNNDKVEYLGNSARNEPESCQLFIAKFVDSSRNRNWHGYPANPSGQKPQDIPSEKVLNDWSNKKYLRAQLIRKISRGQKCKL